MTSAQWFTMTLVWEKLQINWVHPWAVVYQPDIQVTYLNPFICLGIGQVPSVVKGLKQSYMKTVRMTQSLLLHTYLHSVHTIFILDPLEVKYWPLFPCKCSGWVRAHTYLPFSHFRALVVPKALLSCRATRDWGIIEGTLYYLFFFFASLSLRVGRIPLLPHTCESLKNQKSPSRGWISYIAKRSTQIRAIDNITLGTLVFGGGGSSCSPIKAT